MTAAFPFTIDEYRMRLARTRERMVRDGLDVLVVTDPANIYYLSGFCAWSFYVPQALLVPCAESEDPVWVGRPMDAASARLTSWLPASCVVGYPEKLVQRESAHPMDWIGGHLMERGWPLGRVGYEGDGYFFSPRALTALQNALPGSWLEDAGLLVNWVRTTKSEQEIGYIEAAAKHVSALMRSAYGFVRPGRRECDIIGDIYREQMAGSADGAGCITGLPPLLLVGESASAAHPLWTDAVVQDEQTIALELACSRHFYHAGLARTMHLGRVPRRVLDTHQAVSEGMDAVLAALRPSVEARQVEAAWREVLKRHGLSKESRIGYSIGIGFPPDWGEHTISFRPEDESVLQDKQVFHIILGMWMDGWGMELSETVVTTARGCRKLTDCPRDVVVVN